MRLRAGLPDRCCERVPSCHLLFWALCLFDDKRVSRTATPSAGRQGTDLMSKKRGMLKVMPHLSGSPGACPFCRACTPVDATDTDYEDSQPWCTDKSHCEFCKCTCTCV